MASRRTRKPSFAGCPDENLRQASARRQWGTSFPSDDEGNEGATVRMGRSQACWKSSWRLCWSTGISLRWLKRSQTAPGRQHVRCDLPPSVMLPNSIDSRLLHKALNSESFINTGGAPGAAAPYSRLLNLPFKSKGS